MRKDAKRNYDHVLAVASDVVTQRGVDASLRDIARKAGVGLGTLYRHFPTREALLEALLRASFDKLTLRAAELQASSAPDDALLTWLRQGVAVAVAYRGAIASMVAAIDDPNSALHASCVTMRAASIQLLSRAQAKQLARADIDGADLFALIGALAWLGDQPALASRADHLFDVIARSILTKYDPENAKV